MLAAMSGSGSSFAFRALLLCVLFHMTPLPTSALASSAGRLDPTTLFSWSAAFFDGSDGFESLFLPATDGEFAPGAHAIVPLLMGGDLFAPGASQHGAFGDSGDPADGSPFRSLMGGSFLGAFIFGYPYQGIGIPDLAALALLGFVAVYVLLPGKRPDSPQGDDRFTVGRRDSSSTELPRELRPKEPREPNRQRPGGPFAPGDRAAPGRQEGSPERYDARRDGANSPRPFGRQPGRWPVGAPQKQEGEQSAPRPADARNDRELRQPGKGPGQGESPRQGKTFRDLQEALRERMRAKSMEPLAQPVRIAPGVRLPADIDPDDVLDGARVLYVRLQEAWAARDTQSLVPFTTPEMLRLLRERAAAAPQPVAVHILLLDATLSGFEQQGTEETVEVTFSALMSHNNEPPDRIREIWRFTRGQDGDGHWRLDDILEHEEEE